MHVHTAISLLGLGILLASSFARYWMVQHFESRPLLLHDNSVLHCILLVAGLGLAAGFFVLLNLGYRWQSCVFVGVLVAADRILKWWFFRVEVCRMRQSLGCSRNATIQTVKRRTDILVAHFD